MNKKIMVGIIVLGSLVAGNAYGATVADCIGKYQDILDEANHYGSAAAPLNKKNTKTFQNVKDVAWAVMLKSAYVHIAPAIKEGLKKLIDAASAGTGLDAQYKNFVTKPEFTSLFKSFATDKYLMQIAFMQIVYGDGKPFAYTANPQADAKVKSYLGSDNPVIAQYKQYQRSLVTVTLYSFFNGLMGYMSKMNVNTLSPSEKSCFQSCVDTLYEELNACYRSFSSQAAKLNWDPTGKS